MNQKKRTEFFTKWLAVASGVVIAVGLYIALLKTTPLFAPFDAMIDPVFWPAGEIGEAALQFKYFIFSLLGVFMAGWGIQLLFITLFAFRKRQRWAWWSIMVSVVLWFGIDEFFSLYYGVYHNALLNIPFFLMLMIPLVVTVKDFNGRH